VEEEMFAIVIREDKGAKVVSYKSKEIDSFENISICGVESYEQGKRISLIYNRMRELGIRANLSNIYKALKY
jgi:hypothetical protein